MANTINVEDVIGTPESLASLIANKYTEWESFRTNWLNLTQEVRDYVFATDTRNTTTGHLPWKNSTHVPKLCQIRDNLHANYMAAIFPNDYPVQWEGDAVEGETKELRQTIEQYMQTKMRQSKFRTEVSKILYDWIDYGNCFAMPVFVAEYKEGADGKKIPVYVGPKLQRVSPLDIVFDPTAPTFASAPKIIRSLKSIGTLISEIKDKPELQYLTETIEKMTDMRQKFAGHSQGDFAKNDAFAMDGFTSWWAYFTSGYVEVLDFYGDIWDPETNEVKKNHLVTVVDRMFIARDHADETWLGSPPIRHCGWRLRSDNIYAMGPLENLIGMQYRIDHLENAKADAFDLIVHPVLKVKGMVEPFEWKPGGKIYVGDEGDVGPMPPDVTCLQADTQISLYEAKMEEMAGAPKQAMGFRTPGEKTAYEIQVLENGANRIFLNKTSYFEEEFLEELLNDMLELGRRNFKESEIVRVLDTETNAILFQKIRPEDLATSGRIRPVGARHFAQNATMVQNLTNLYGSNLAQDPAVMSHLSGKRIAELMEHLLGVERFKLFGENVRVQEQAETQQLVEAAKMGIKQQNDAVDPEGLYQEPPPENPRPQPSILDTAGQ